MPEASSSLTITRSAFKQDISKYSLSKYFQRSISWLFTSFSEISKIVLEQDPNKFSATKHTSLGITGITTAVYVSDSTRKGRSSFANSILAAFKDGPLFFSSPVESDSIDFLWHSSKDKVEKEVTKDRLQDVDFAKKTIDKLATGGSSKSSRYSIAYYSFSGTLDELREILSGVKSFNGKAEIDEAVESDKRIEAKCILDLTVKGDKEGTNDESKIRDAGDLLNVLKKPLGAKRKTQFGKSYLVFEAAKRGEGFVEKITSTLDGNNDFGNLDKSFYSALFNAIEENERRGNDFKMRSLKKKIVSEGLSFEDVLKEQRTYGAVVSELLVPFLLLNGYVKIDGKEILKGLPENDKVVSVEFPESKTNVLTDYNVGFASSASLVETDSGKKYAVSAKWTDGHNSSGLFSLIYDNVKMFGKKVLDQYKKDAGKDSPFTIAVDIVEKDGTHKAMPKKTIDLAGNKNVVNNAFINNISKVVSFDRLKHNKYYVVSSKHYSDEFRNKLSTAIEAEFKNESSKKIHKIVDLFPYSAPLICDKKLAETLDEDADFLLTLYDFIYGYYGKDVEFQQIQLNPDLSMKYFTKEADVSEKNVGDYIKIESVASVKRNYDSNDYYKAINIAQPLRVVLLK